jgi:Tol biopolymer transport system component
MRTGVLAGVAGAVAACLLAAGVAVYAFGDDGRSPGCGDPGERQRITSSAGGTAFVRCDADGSAWLYVAPAAGAEPRRIAPERYGCCYRPSESVVFRDPAWSPDGRRIAVVVDDVGGSDVWVVEASGRAAARVTSGPARESRPRWSPDGRRVTFRTETGGVATADVPGASASA